MITLSKSGYWLLITMLALQHGRKTPSYREGYKAREDLEQALTRLNSSLQEVSMYRFSPQCVKFVLQFFIVPREKTL